MMEKEKKTWLLRLLIQVSFIVFFVLFLVRFEPNRNFMLVAALTVVLITLVFRTGFCGWLCPLGTLLDAMRKFGVFVGGLSFMKPINRRYRRFIRNNCELLDKIDRYSRFFKYIFLLWILQSAIWGFMTIKSGSEHGIVAVLPIVIFMLVLGIFIDRAWCRYLCPLGGLIGLFGRVGLSQIERNADTCIDCNRCTRACPLNIDVANKVAVNDLDCNTCLKCVEVCPVDKTLDLRFKFKEKSKIASPVYGLIVLVLLMGTLITTHLLGIWDVSEQTGEKFKKEHVMIDKEIE
jgi:polyferredoxin